MNGTICKRKTVLKPEYRMDNQISLGIVGGLGPEDTVNYYQNIINEYRSRLRGQETPDIAIESLNFYPVINMLEKGDFSGAAEYIASAAEHLYQSGVDFGVLCGHIPNSLFSDIQERTSLSLISITKAVIDYCKKLGLKKVALLDDKDYMDEIIAINEFNDAGIKLFLPNDYDQNFFYRVNNFPQQLPDFYDQKRILCIVSNLMNNYGVEAVMVIRQGTLQLLNGQMINARLLDLTKIHQNAVVSRLLHGM